MAKATVFVSFVLLWAHAAGNLCYRAHVVAKVSVPFPLLLMQGGVLRGDPNCPVQPIPVALPNPLPSGIQVALTKLESLMQSSLNNDTMVRN